MEFKAYIAITYGSEIRQRATSFSRDLKKICALMGVEIDHQDGSFYASEIDRMNRIGTLRRIFEVKRTLPQAGSYHHLAQIFEGFANLHKPGFETLTIGFR